MKSGLVGGCFGLLSFNQLFCCIGLCLFFVMEYCFVKKDTS